MLLFFQISDIQSVIVFIPLVAVIIGAIVGATVTYLYGKAQTKKQNTFLLSNEFNTDEMLKSRLAANQLLEKNVATLNELKNQAGDDYYHVARVLHFFDSLDKLKQSGLIDANLACSLFGGFFEHFNEYFRVLFQAQMENPNEWSYVVERVTAIKWLKSMKGREFVSLRDEAVAKQLRS